MHPKAQAALGSLFVDLVLDAGKSFVIETHSDYIYNRIQQKLLWRRIKPTSIGIFFFEKVGMETITHPLRLDETGNIIGALTGYRQFFLEEEYNLLNRTALNVLDN